MTTALKSTDPNNQDDLVQIFIHWLPATFTFANPDDDPAQCQSHFEHGQWWITHPPTGASWSVVDAEGPGTVDGYDFEQISEGEDC